MKISLLTNENFHYVFDVKKMGKFYSKKTGNHEFFSNNSAYIIHQSFLYIIILLFQFWHTNPKSINFNISYFFHKIKNVTVNNSSIVKSVKFCSKWSLDHFYSFSSSWDILILRYMTSYSSLFLTQIFLTHFK